MLSAVIFTSAFLWLYSSSLACKVYANLLEEAGINIADHRKCKSKGEICPKIASFILHMALRNMFWLVKHLKFPLTNVSLKDWKNYQWFAFQNKYISFGDDNWQICKKVLVVIIRNKIPIIHLSCILVKVTSLQLLAHTYAQCHPHQCHLF